MHKLSITILIMSIGAPLLLPSSPAIAGAPAQPAGYSWYAAAQAAQSRGDDRAAVVDFREAHAADPTNLFYVLGLSQAYVDIGAFDSSAAVLTRELLHFRAADDQTQLRQSLAQTQTAWGDALLAKSRYPEATLHLLAALAIDEPTSAAAAAYDDERLAVAWDGLDDTARAEQALESARRLRRGLGDIPGEASDLNQLGLLRDAGGDFSGSLAAYDRAAKLLKSEKAANSAAYGSIVNNRGLAYQHADQYELAVGDFRTAFANAHSSSDPHRAAAAVNNIGADMHMLGAYQMAIADFDRALIQFRFEGNQDREAAAISNIGYSEYYLGHDEQSDALLRQAIGLYRAAGDRRGEEVAIGNLGWLDRSRARYAEAERLENEALADTKALGDPVGEGIALLELGKIEASLKRPAAAIAFYDRAVVVLRTTPAAAMRAKTYTALMLAWRDLGDPGLAIFWGKQAVNTYQEIRGDIQGLDIDLQAGFVKSHTDAYRELADQLISQGRIPEAQKVLDLLKLDELDEFERGGRVLVRGDRIPVRGGPVLVRGGRDPLRGGRVLVRGNRDPLRGGVVLVRGVRPPLRGGELQRAESGFGVDGIELSAGEAQLAYQIATASSDSLAKLLATLPAGYSAPAIGAVGDIAALRPTPLIHEAYVATLVGASRLSVIVTTRAGQITSTADISAGDVNSDVFRLRAELGDPSSDPRADSEAMYRVLMPRAVCAALARAQVTKIIWSLDGALRYIPMAALYDGHQYLVERYESEVRGAAVEPSADGTGDGVPAPNTSNGSAFAGGRIPLHEVQAQQSDPSRPPLWGIGLGDSAASIYRNPVTGVETAFDALPAVSTELHEVISETSGDKGIVPGHILLDHDFTARAMVAALTGSCPLVHFATHFELMPGDDEQSYLLLGDGAAMTLAQIEAQPHLFRGVTLLTLSACNTAVGGDGKEIDGLAAVAEQQGAKSVVATLWPVTDTSTQLMMQAFYTNHVTMHESVSQSLREAQLSVMRSTISSASITAATPRPNAPPYAHPYYWAPIILMSNGN